ncbi:uncharacterized protein [Diadema setosum]|uniref:uncharacterized protein n=1 Tax=Diadema setosum TaxID=31175 RepID=UPI003B3BBA7B
MDRKYDLVLLLTLAATVLCGHSGKGRLVGNAPNVQGWKGENIRLPCGIQEKPLAVVWVQERISEEQQRTIKAEFVDGDFRSREERFDIDKNFSLVITDLEVADEGHYYCQVVLKNFENFDNSTLLTISAMTSRHTIDECDDKSQSHHSRCTYHSPSNNPSFTLTCVVSGFKPNISMLWTEESGEKLNSVDSQQNTLSDGTYERFETITVSAKHWTEQTFMCVATGDSLNGTSTREITILPIHISGKRAHFSLIIGLAIGLPAALIIVFLLVGKFLQNKHPDYLPRKGCGWNPCWRRPNKPERFNDEEELMLSMEIGSSSLTEEQVQKCQEELMAYYRLSQRKVTVEPLNFMERVELDDIYTNLSIIDRTSKGNTKTPITYEDLVTNDEHTNLSKRLLIQGEGGVGKSTLCAKIAWDWCQGRILQDLDMVLLIPLRDVTNKRSIGGIVKTYLSDSNPAKSYQIDDYISRNQSRIVIIFDGFDEFNGKLSEKDSSEVIHILRMEQYKSCKVIVTTRPWRTDEFVMEKKLADAYTFLNVEGFNTENLSAYIKRYFLIREKNNRAESLISFMEENEVIRANMAPFPIYCAMLCLMWNNCSEEKQEKMQELKTFSKIFREMISFLKEHFASKTCGNLQNQNVLEQLKKAHGAIQDISEIALNGLLDRNLSFPEEQFRDCHDAMETCCSVGVLTTETEVIPRDRRRDANFLSLVSSTVSFPHKLFQEYIAALYIYNLFANDRPQYEKVKSEFLSRCQEFRYLLYFTSALGNELGLDIIQGLIDSAPHFVMDYTREAYRKSSDDRRYRDFCVDVAFECHTEEAARAVGKRWKEYELSSDVAGYEHTTYTFENHTEEAARVVGERQKKYQLSSYSPEHTNSGVAFMMRFNQVPSLEINSVKCGRTVSRDLAEGMCSRSVLRKVEISNSQFHTDFYNILGAEASNCQIEDLMLYYSSHYNDLWLQTSTGGDLARCVCTMPRLLKFRLVCPYLPDSFLSTAVASASSCQIQDLELHVRKEQEYIKHQSSGGGDLARWVCTMPGLRKFKLSCLFLPNGFLSTAIALSSSCQIEDLMLYYSSHYNDLWLQTSTGGDLARCVCTMPRLLKFRLVCPYLPDSFLSTAVASASSCQIQDLHLIFDDSIQDDSHYQVSMGDDLAKWVFAMPRLSKFSLECPYMSDTFLSTAVTSASSCQISEVYLEPSIPYSSLVSESGAANLAEILCRLPNLTRARLNLVELPETFFTTISSQASRCKVECITINDKPLRSFLSDNQGIIQVLSYDSSSEDESSQESDQGSGQENFPAPDESETNN